MKLYQKLLAGVIGVSALSVGLASQIHLAVPASYEYYNNTYTFNAVNAYKEMFGLGRVTVDNNGGIKVKTSSPTKRELESGPFQIQVTVTPGAMPGENLMPETCISDMRYSDLSDIAFAENSPAWHCHS